MKYVPKLKKHEHIPCLDEKLFDLIIEAPILIKAAEFTIIDNEIRVATINVA